MKKCIYCKKEISDDSVIDFCENCGKRVFGDKMFDTIVKNMQNARDKGDLYQGTIGLQGTKVEDELKKLKKPQTF